MSIACVEENSMCKRRRTTEPEGSQCCAVATAFFQDNALEEDEDDEAFGTSSVPNDLSEIAAETSETEEDAASVTELDDDGRDVTSMTEVDEDEAGIDGIDGIDGLSDPVVLGDPNEEYETLIEEPLETVEPEVEDEMEEIAAEEEVEVTVEPEEEVPPDVIDVPVDDVPALARTPSTEQSSEDETGYSPKHHSSVPHSSCLRSPGTPPPNAGRVSFVQLEVADGHLLNDATGLREVIHLDNYRGLNLWFHTPGAAVECSWCEGSWPQTFGSLTGNQTGSQFAQYEFVCQRCANAEQAWLATQAQEAATATSAPEITPEPTGPWDNPGSGWNDWANE